MVSEGNQLEWTPLDNSLQVGAGSELHFRVAGRQKKKLFFDDNDEIRLFVGDLRTKAAWRDTLQVVGRADGSQYPWERDKTTADPIVFFPPEVNDAVDEIDFILSDIEAKEAGEVQLKIELTLGEKSHGNSFPVYLLQQAPQIKRFRATPTILVNGADAKLEWSLENALDFEIRNKKYRKIQLGDSSQTSCRLSINEENLAVFHLIARRDKALTTKTVEIRVFSESGWQSGWQPPDGQIAGLIVGSAQEEIYAIVRGRKNSIWQSSDGISNWQKIDDGVPNDMVTCPGVHFNNQLVLVGGSKIYPSGASNEVYRFDLKDRKWSRLPVSEKAIWEPRMGHASIVFPDQDGIRKVWVMGGADKFLNALNDVWVWDGNDQNEWEPKKYEIPWPKRCLFGAGVLPNEIWLGGGFEQPQGSGLNDIWRWDGNAWQRLKGQTGDLQIIDSGILCASTLVSLGSDVYFIGAKKDLHYKALFANLKDQRQPGNWYAPPTPVAPFAWTLARPDFTLEAVAFNGCIWLFSQAYRGKRRVENSGLYYWIPPKGSIIG